MMVCSFYDEDNIKKTGNDKYLSKALPDSNNKSMLVSLRDFLVHDLHKTKDWKSEILNGIISFGVENTNFVSKLCFDDDIDLYEQLVEICSIQNENDFDWHIRW